MQVWAIVLVSLLMQLNGQHYIVQAAAAGVGAEIGQWWLQHAVDAAGSSTASIWSSQGAGISRTSSNSRKMLQTAANSMVPYRIIGGVEALENRFKYVCSLRDGYDQHYCGCSLIAPSVILTAAHCLNQTDPALHNPIVEVGRFYRTAANGTADDGTADNGNDFDRLYCTTSMVHPGWTFSAAQHDVGLCFLNGSSRWPTIALASGANVVFVGTNVSILGFGATVEGGQGSDALMINTVPLTDRTACNVTYGGKVHNTQLCAGVPQGGADACQGDSGGPMILEGSEPYQDVQLGIVSFGGGCGRPGIPGVYTDVRSYRGYIAQQFQAQGVSYTPVTQGYLPSSATAAPAPVTAATPPVTASSSTGSTPMANTAQSPASSPPAAARPVVAATPPAPVTAKPPSTTSAAKAPTTVCINTIFGRVCSAEVAKLLGLKSQQAAGQQASTPAAVRAVDATVRSVAGMGGGAQASPASGTGINAGQQQAPLVRAALGFWSGFTESLQQSG